METKKPKQNISEKDKKTDTSQPICQSERTLSQHKCLSTCCDCKLIINPTLSTCCGDDKFSFSSHNEKGEYVTVDKCCTCGKPFIPQEKECRCPCHTDTIDFISCDCGIHEQQSKIAHIQCPLCGLKGEQIYKDPATLADCFKEKWHDCKGFSLPKEDWMDKEREAFLKEFCTYFSSLQVSIVNQREIADYWLSRIQSIIMSKMEK